jgi:5-oxoprolinase (ATP-hydrolysing) subunit C
MTLTVITPGLETAIQDWPGRRGFINQGFPISGPFDSWSFRLANRLVGNDPGTAALECQFLGPTLRFDVDTVVAVTGAEMAPNLEGAPIETWTSVAVRAGQTLALGPARSGARTYIAVPGGIANPPMLGSRSTFHKAGVGGLGGKALSANQSVPIAGPAVLPPAGRRVDPSRRPPIAGAGRWVVEVVLGPNDDWISAEGHERFFGTEWKLSAKSDRTGMRLEGPDWLFASRAIDKPPENGKAPSNIIDQGYPLGAINLAGSTPIILPVDGPSMGGFINPYTVITAALWKLGQARPGNFLRFVALDVEVAQERARALARLCGPDAIT